MIPQAYVLIGFLVGVVFAIGLLWFALIYDHKKAMKNSHIHQARCTNLDELFELISLIQRHHAAIAYIGTDDWYTEYRVTFRAPDDEFEHIFNAWLENPFKGMTMEVE